MKYTPLILVLFSVFTLNSCDSDLKFNEPQPIESKDEKNFKRRYQGEFLNTADSTILKIEKDKIIQKWNLFAKMTRAEIDSTEGIEIKNGQLYSVDFYNPIPVKFDGDTVIISMEIDTSLFVISSDQVLKSLNGIYFLNSKTKDNLWTVKVLNFDEDGKLILRGITNGKEEIEKIKNISPVSQIEDQEGRIVEYTVKPTKKEWKEILKSENFSDRNEYIRIKRKNGG